MEYDIFTPFIDISSTPTRLERAKVFIGDHLSANDLESADNFASELYRPDRPLSSTVVIIPVAAHQDAQLISHTMGEYAKQKTEEPFSVVLSLNAPWGESLEEAEAEVERSKKQYPELDLRSTSTFYDLVTMGQIRRDIWNGAFMLAYHDGLFSQGNQEVIGINNDIDTHFISPHYISRIQKYYRTRQEKLDQIHHPHLPFSTVGTLLRHATLPSHPHVGMVTKWQDQGNFELPGHTNYEAGFVIPFSHYARQQGFNAQAHLHETEWPDSSTTRTLVGAQLYTSPRRFVERLVNHPKETIWTEASFGPTDPCRDTLPPDLTKDQAEQLIRSTLDQEIQGAWLSAVSLSHAIRRQRNTYRVIDVIPSALDLQENDENVRKQLRKAERFMRAVVGSECLAKELHDSIEAYVEHERKKIDILLDR